MELKPIADNNIITERFVEAPTINRFRCCLHKLIVDVVGVNKLVGIREKDIPGTSDFHIQHRVLLEAEYGMKAGDWRLAEAGDWHLAEAGDWHLAGAGDWQPCSCRYLRIFNVIYGYHTYNKIMYNMDEYHMYNPSPFRSI